MRVVPFKRRIQDLYRLSEALMFLLVMPEQLANRTAGISNSGLEALQHS